MNKTEKRKESLKIVPWIVAILLVLSGCSGAPAASQAVVEGQTPTAIVEESPTVGTAECTPTSSGCQVEDAFYANETAMAKTAAVAGSTPTVAATVPTDAQATPSVASEMSVDEVSQAIAQGAFILDVRTQEEYDQGHIDGATLIPLDQLPDRLNEVPKDKLVITVCRSGKRSAQGRDILLSNGFTDVTSMSGGMNEWQAQGLPVVTK